MPALELLFAGIKLAQLGMSVAEAARTDNLEEAQRLLKKAGSHVGRADDAFKAALKETGRSGGS